MSSVAFNGSKDRFGARTPFPAIVAVVVLLIGCALSQSLAQDPWAQGQSRPSLAGASAATNRFASRAAENYNLAFGPIHFRLSAGVSAEFNDNINISETDRKSDIIIGPHLNLAGVWRVTELNELTLNMGIGFQEHLNNPTYSGNTILISPDSRLQFSIFINDCIRINIHDAFSISSDPTEVSALSNSVKYNRFQNTAGTDVIWDLNRIVLTLGYSHANYISLTKEYDYLNHSSDMFSISPCSAITQATNLGLDASLSQTHFEQNFQNDSTMFSVGPFVDNTLTHCLKLRLSGGFQGGMFSSGGGNQDSSNLTGWFCNLTVAHQISRFYMETLSAGHESQLGLQTNYEVVDYVRYTLNMTSIRSVPCNFYAFYEHVQESPAAISQRMERYGTGVNFGFKLVGNVRMSVDYQFLLKNSNWAFYNYYQNRILLTLDYQF